MNSFRFWILNSDSYYPRHSHAVSVSISEERLELFFHWTRQMLRQVLLVFRVPALWLHFAGIGAMIGAEQR